VRCLRLTVTRTVPTLRPALLLWLALGLSLALSAALAGSARANAHEVTKIYEECANGTLPSGFSQQDYSQALKELEPFLVEYSDCPDLINKAQRAAVGAHGEPGGGGSRVAVSAVAPPTPTEQRTLEDIPHAGAPSVPLGTQVVHPGVAHVNLASALSTLPTPLLVLLASMLACALLVLAWAVRRRVRRSGGTPGGGDPTAGG
jgi:hypothetical protein